MTTQNTNLYLVLILTCLSMSIIISTYLSLRRERFEDLENYLISDTFETRKRRRRSWRYSPFLRLFSFFLCYIALILCVFCVQSIMSLRAMQTIDADDLTSQITTIAEELSSSSNELTNIQKELENRIATVQDLKREAEIAENVISLTTEQVNAIQAKLNQELEQSNKKNTITTIIVSAVFFGLGLIVNPIYNMVKKKRNKSEPETEKFDLNGHSKEDVELALKMFDAVKSIDTK